MMLRFALITCAATAFAAQAFAQAPARCEETSFRIYFAPDAAALDETALETIAAAERNVAACGYAELHVIVDASSAHAAARGQAILAASDARVWDVRAVEQRSSVREASLRGGPDYAEVLMTPRAMPVGAPVREAETGV